MNFGKGKSVGKLVEIPIKITTGIVESEQPLRQKEHKQENENMEKKGQRFHEATSMTHTHSKSEYGIWPVNISNTVQPRLHMSAGSP